MGLFALRSREDAVGAEVPPFEKAMYALVVEITWPATWGAFPLSQRGSEGDLAVSAWPPASEIPDRTTSQPAKLPNNGSQVSGRPSPPLQKGGLGSRLPQVFQRLTHTDPYSRGERRVSTCLAFSTASAYRAFEKALYAFVVESTWSANLGDFPFSKGGHLPRALSIVSTAIDPARFIRESVRAEPVEAQPFDRLRANGIHV